MQEKRNSLLPKIPCTTVTIGNVEKVEKFEDTKPL